MTVVRRERVSASVVEAYRGTFSQADRPRVVGDELPPAWEGVLFGFAVPLADLRPDGTPARDGILPEIDLPRRMYAGEDSEFYRPLRIGDEVTQTATAGEVVEKCGSRGRMVFADIVREFHVDGELAVRSIWHDVFLEASDAPARPPQRWADAAVDTFSDFTLDARQLFRFSALTFNTHLIHYDRRFVREVEGQPDLLVHGPLTRILLMDAARRHNPQRTVADLSVRALAPILVDQRVRLHAVNEEGRTRVNALGDDGAILARADLRWRG